jgi:hypothetical protein
MVFIMNTIEFIVHFEYVFIILPKLQWPKYAPNSLLSKFQAIWTSISTSMKKTNSYCNKSCESKLNLKNNIFYEHMAITWINMI